MGRPHRHFPLTSFSPLTSDLLPLVEPTRTTDCIQVTTTTASHDEAVRLATAVVGQRLAACAQIWGPLTSTYWWHGKVETATEWICCFKTTGGRYQELDAKIRELHSYDTPEILAVPVVSGSKEYLRWIANEVSGEQ